jgi:iron complex outermembrane receptor protein
MFKRRFGFILALLLHRCLINSQVLLHGAVNDSISKKPISDAQVMLLEKDIVVYTASNGTFTLNIPGEQPATLKVTAMGYQTSTFKIDKAETTLYILLNPQHVDLHEVTVSGLAVQTRNQNAFHIETRKVSALNAVPTLTMGELIGKIPGVYQAGLGLGISKPVIRGLQGMRVVSLMNGMRVEAQQWGGDHGLGMAELGIGSVEVIKGPASLMYGADALGGVIHYTDAPPVAVGTMESQVQVLANTATMGGVTRLVLRYSGLKWRYMFGGSLANHADFKLPNGNYAQNSRFNEEVLRGVVSYTSKKGLHNLRYTYNRTITGIPGHSHDSMVNYLDFQTPIQKRTYTLPAQFFNNHFVSFDNKWFFKKSELFALISFTQNRLIEYDEKVTIPSLGMTLQNSAYNLRYTKNIKHWKWISGIMGMLQSNINTKKATDQLIPNSQTIDNGLFTTFFYSKENVNIQGGIRYDIREILVQSDSVNKRFKYNGLNGALGLVYQTKSWVFRGALSTGFRAPHLTELLSSGFHHGALRYEIGDQKLIPEKATQLDLTSEWQKEHFSIHLNPYVNYIRDFIALQPIDSMVDALPVFTYNRIPEVYYYGVDFGLHAHPHFIHRLHLEVNTSLLNTYTQKDSVLSFIPQPRIQSQIRYEFRLGQNVKLKDVVIQHAWMGDQRRVSFYESPSKQYQLIDLGINLLIGKKEQLELSFGCKNCFNEQYIDHLSRLKNIQMPGIGRNFYINVKYNVTTKITKDEKKNH